MPAPPFHATPLFRPPQHVRREVGTALELDGLGVLLVDAEHLDVALGRGPALAHGHRQARQVAGLDPLGQVGGVGTVRAVLRSEEHTSELQSLMRNSYAAFCLKKNNHLLHAPHSGDMQNLVNMRNTAYEQYL